MDAVIGSVWLEGIANKHLAFYPSSHYNVYLLPSDKRFSAEHPWNIEVS
jgi:hypothetical protein